jgi:ectoine hydroxylase-related dioxygenase (phytanoyl-CoA dioxygenase family)
MPPRLSSADRDRFARDGVLLVDEPVLPAADFASLGEDFRSALDDWTTTFGRRPEQMDKPHFLYPELFATALHPAVLDLVEGLIGPDIALFTTHFICKPPGDGQRVPWHEDSAYWAGMIEPMDAVCTVWLAIDPSSRDNGCVRFIPGSHLVADGAYERVADPHASVFDRELVRGAVDERRALDAVLAPNRCSIHHARTIHGSEANHGATRRCGFTMRYFSTRCRFTHQDQADPDFRIYLARGRDHAGNRYGTVGEVNLAWRERLLAEKVGA